MSRWSYVADTAEIPVEQVKTFCVQGQEVLVYYNGNNYYVYPNRCTHRSEVPIANGFVVKGAIVCRLHGAKFDLKTGACLRSPAYADLQRYSVEIRDDQLYIDLDTQLPTRSAQRGHEWNACLKLN